MLGDEKSEKFRQMMVAVDGSNRRWGLDTVRFTVADPEGRWRTRSEKQSPRYTTQFNEVLTIHQGFPRPLIRDRLRREIPHLYTLFPGDRG